MEFNNYKKPHRQPQTSQSWLYAHALLVFKALLSNEFKILNLIHVGRTRISGTGTTRFTDPLTLESEGCGL